MSMKAPLSTWTTCEVHRANLTVGVLAGLELRRAGGGVEQVDGEVGGNEPAGARLNRGRGKSDLSIHDDIAPALQRRDDDVDPTGGVVERSGLGYIADCHSGAALKQRVDALTFGGVGIPPGAGQELDGDARLGDEEVTDAGSEHSGGACD